MERAKYLLIVFLTLFTIPFFSTEARRSQVATVNMRKINLSALKSFYGIQDLVAIPTVTATGILGRPKVSVIIKGESGVTNRPSGPSPYGPSGIYFAWLQGDSIVLNPTPLFTVPGDQGLDVAALWLGSGTTTGGQMFVSQTDNTRVRLSALPFDSNGMTGSTTSLYTFNPPSPHTAGFTVAPSLNRDSVAVMARTTGATIGLGINWYEYQSTAAPTPRQLSDSGIAMPAGSGGPNSYTLYFTSFALTGQALKNASAGIIRKQQYSTIHLWAPPVLWPYWGASTDQWKEMSGGGFIITQNDLWYHAYTTNLKSSKIATSKDGVYDKYGYVRTLDRFDGMEPDSLIYQEKSYNPYNSVYYYNFVWEKQGVNKGTKVGTPATLHVPSWVPVLKPKSGYSTFHYSEKFSNFVVTANNIYYGVLTRSLTRKSYSSPGKVPLLANTDSNAYLVRLNMATLEVEVVGKLNVNAREGDYFDYSLILPMGSELLIYLERASANTYAREAFSGIFALSN